MIIKLTTSWFSHFPKPWFSHFLLLNIKSQIISLTWKTLHFLDFLDFPTVKTLILFGLWLNLHQRKISLCLCHKPCKTIILIITKTQYESVFCKLKYLHS